MGDSLVGIFKKLGKLVDLRTQNKDNLVSSINEIADKTSGIDTMKTKLDSSVGKIEAGLNYNTIKITKNDGTVENVLIKTQGVSGSSINVFKSSQVGGSFIATEKTNTFTIDGIDTTKDVDLIYNNLVLVNNVDYTLDKTSGVVGLSFELEIDEVIYYVITNTSYDYNDLDNLPDLSLKADTSITNSLSEQIGVLNNDRGYLNGVIVSDANNINLNGKYILTNTTLNKPSENQDWYACDATFENGGITGRVTATCYAGDNLGRTYTRVNLHGTWYDWQEIATTDPTVVTIPSNTDLSTYIQTMKENKIYRQVANTGVTNSPNPELYCFYTKEGSTINCVVFEGVNSTYYITNTVNNGYFGWKQVSTTDSSMQIKIMPNGTSTKSCTEIGIYKCSQWTDYPSTNPDAQGMLVVIKYTGGDSYPNLWCTQTFYNPHGNQQWIKATAGTMEGDWLEVTTNATLDERGYLNSRRLHGYDMNNLGNNGFYTGDNWANAPTNVSTEWFNVIVTKTIDNYVTQLAFSANNNGKVYVRQLSGTWREWQEISTTTTINLTLLNAWQAHAKAIKNGGIVSIVGSMFAGTVTPGTIIMTGLPYAYDSAVFEFYNGSVQSVGSGYISPSGDMIISQVTSGLAVGTQVFFSVSYPIA